MLLVIIFQKIHFFSTFLTSVKLETFPNWSLTSPTMYLLRKCILHDAVETAINSSSRSFLWNVLGALTNIIFCSLGFCLIDFIKNILFKCLVNIVYTLNLHVKQARVDDIGIDTAGFMFLQSIGCPSLLLCKGHSYNTGVQLLGRCKKSWLQLVLKLLSNSTSLMSLARSGSQWPGSQLSKGAEQRCVEPVTLREV